MAEEFSVRDWLSSGAKGVREAVRSKRGGLLPTEFHEHMKASRKEFLMAFRSLVDVALDKLDKPDKPTRTTKIKVD
jgi:hypothetical protein